MAGLFAPDPVLLHARLRPTSLACVDLATNRRWTYAELNSDIQRATAVLSAYAVEAGDRVATVCINSVHQIMLQQALMRLGAIFVPLNWRLAQPELSKLLDDCTPTIIFTDRDPPELPLGCRHIEFSRFCEEIDDADPGHRLQSRPSQETSIILYTSGTSGTPKGVVLTARSILATTVDFSVLTEADAGCVFLCDGPMFHFMGLIAQIWPPLMRGGTLLVSPRFNPEATNRRLSDPRLGITHYFCVPQMAEALSRAVNFDPSAWLTIKALFTGGAPNPPARIKWWLDRGICMVDGYGSTEMGTISGMPLSPEMIIKKAGSVGHPGPLTSVRIVDDQGQPLLPGAIGEVVASRDVSTPVYWNNVGEDNASLVPDGWFRTGDMGWVDEDGFIFLVDRKKHMFISGGENVYPAEVEAALIEHPDVVEAAVLGIPDETWGEAGRAYVVTSSGSRIPQADMVTHCQCRIARFKIPKEFHFVSGLPRTGSGKVMKHLLSEDTVSRL
ncbi:acylsynthetase [Colletotrichum kahawae]|uniref:Acylsynthetase n=1 Tax=Colletotrichum kahawae TaxID=34407 RepID=A0AAD9YM47_COLKA|nr:acylsynthetase [Colletotrichum kahawae]